MNVLTRYGLAALCSCATLAVGQIRLGTVYAPPLTSHSDRVVGLGMYTMTPSGDVVYGRHRDGNQEVWVGRVDDPGVPVWSGDETIRSVAGNGAGVVAFSVRRQLVGQGYYSTAHVVSPAGHWMLPSAASGETADVLVAPMGVGSRVGVIESLYSLHLHDVDDPWYFRLLDRRELPERANHVFNAARVLDDGDVAVWARSSSWGPKAWVWNPQFSQPRLTFDEWTGTSYYLDFLNPSFASDGRGAALTRIRATNEQRIIVFHDGLFQELDLRYEGVRLSNFGGVSINSLGQVLFTASDTLRTGLYLHESGVTTRIAQTLEPFLHTRPMSLHLGPNSLNDRGDFAFWATMETREVGYFGGSIPSPGSLILATAAIPLGAFRRNRR